MTQMTSYISAQNVYSLSWNKNKCIKFYKKFVNECEDIVVGIIISLKKNF